MQKHFFAETCEQLIIDGTMANCRKIDKTTLTSENR
jgi:hypothetical protein